MVMVTAMAGVVRGEGSDSGVKKRKKRGGGEEWWRREVGSSAIKKNYRNRMKN